MTETEKKNNPAREKAIVLLSGGLDSCVCAAIAYQTYQVSFLHVNYGQRTMQRELEAFQAIASYYQVTDLLTVDLAYLQKIGGSSLTDHKITVPQSGTIATGIPNTYVPFRNSHLLAIAVSWGETIGANRIFIGAVFEDSSGYPDCRPSYFEAFNALIEQGTKPSTHLQIETPIIHLTKGQIVQQGQALKAPLHHTWSCYINEEQACGRCESCVLRLKGFKNAGLEDPIPYQV